MNLPFPEFPTILRYFGIIKSFNISGLSRGKNSSRRRDWPDQLGGLLGGIKAECTRDFYVKSYCAEFCNIFYKSSFVEITRDQRDSRILFFFVKISGEPKFLPRVIDFVEEVGCLFLDVLLIIAQGRNVTGGDVPIVQANIRESVYILRERRSG